MLDYTIGQVIFSKCGRDKNKPFVILDIKDDYVYIVDGSLRKIEKPKKKKFKHIQITNYIDEYIKLSIEKKRYILDADIKKAILKFNNYRNIRVSDMK